MSDTILSGDFTVYYLAENRQKRIEWTGSATGTRTVNELYSALQDLFDQQNQMDDGIPMSAQTPTEYTMGKIDPGDAEPWFMDKATAERLTGGAIKTTGWRRVTGSNTGIIKVICDNTDIVEADIGQDISGATTGSGVLLDVKGTGAGSELWIRPDSSAAGDDFTTNAQVITCNGNTATQTGALSYTGEMLWANVYTIGTIEDDTRIYVYQNGNKLAAYKGSIMWWDDGQIDVLVLVADQVSSLSTRNEFVDQGYVTVFARQYSKTYDNFTVDLFTGGRNPIPLATADDLNNETGIASIQLHNSAGTFAAGNEIQSTDAVPSRGIITEVAGTNPDAILRYYPIGDVTNLFATGDTVVDQTSGASGDANEPDAFGPALLSGLGVTHGATAADITEDGTPELYSIAINVNNDELADMYEWAKYITREGETGTVHTDGIEGEQYIGSEYRIGYNGISGAISEGAVVEQVSTKAAGTVVAHHTTDEILILRNTRGTFNGTNNIYVSGSPANFVTGPDPTAFSPVKAAPFGTFAGGVFFGAPGVLLYNYKATEENLFQLIDDTGAVRLVPTKISFSMANLVTGDAIAAFRTSGGVIDKAMYYISSGQGATGSAALSVTGDINADEPGKTTGGIVRVVDTSAQAEQRYRYSSWTNGTFSLFQVTGQAEAGTNEQKIVDTGAFGSVEVGDIVRNITQGLVDYVASISGSDVIYTNNEISGQGSGDSYDVGGTVQNYATGDSVYVPLIDTYKEDNADESVSIVFVSSFNYRARARQAGVIIPFESNGQVTGANETVTVIRTEDTIYS
jgi:hypothetical protein